MSTNLSQAQSAQQGNRTQDGKYTFGTHAEPEAVSLSHQSENYTDPNDLPAAPVVLTLQRWDGDDAETVEKLSVDGRTLFAGMDRDEMDDLMESELGDGFGDSLYNHAVDDGLVKSWDGPYEFDAGQALRDLYEEDPAILDQLSEARLDPGTYYSAGPDGRLRSAEESLQDDLSAQYDLFEKAKEDLAHLQLRGFASSIEKYCPHIEEIAFAHDGDDDDPLFVNTTDDGNGGREVYDNGAFEATFEGIFKPESGLPRFDFGGAISTDRSYSIADIKNFRPQR